MGKWMTGLLSVFGLVSLSLTLINAPAEAEMYVSGQVGMNLPQSLSNVEHSSGGATFEGNDQSLKSSMMYGAKLGYYFESLKWLGVETEVFKTTPYLEQQNVTNSRRHQLPNRTWGTPECLDLGSREHRGEASNGSVRALCRNRVRV